MDGVQRPRKMYANTLRLSRTLVPSRFEEKGHLLRFRRHVVDGEVGDRTAEGDEVSGHQATV